MREKKRIGVSYSGFGTGYTTVIMLFVIITLTVLAALSFSAAGSNAGQGDRASEFTAAYYAAENKANETLMRIDEAAIEAYADGTFDMLGDKISADGAAAVRNDEGFTVSWSEPVSKRVTLSCEVVVYAEPSQHENKRYSVTKWDTVSGGSAADTRINVWDGTF